ncbi:TonB-dependent receptor [Massilia sp. R2A-15]|uniref:TonB-dependent receptor domain-containing protein n=1 Tax=Massilia sp. R2A-15 TaxID=3064278 RepID=UPI0027353873|nr:TonB-dependent receptor [Massilia sp. R2A-15]WLI89142.1 TonB-dependent receptor [Massilia sp. R2A-15]
MKLKKIAYLIALIGAVGPAVAQEAQSQQPIQRVEITGSSIKRIAKEGALPVQVITFEDMEKRGITTSEELIRSISANGIGADNAVSGNNVFGADADRVSGGASFAALRSLGPNATLVLLNGRRIATHGGSGKAVDLNSIPLGAISRVEILKDGASAIYGTDAIGGVVNFILKSNYVGNQISGTGSVTEAGGGTNRRGQLLVGRGDLDTDGWNAMFSMTVDSNDKLSSKQRDFANGYQPLRGLSPDTTGTPFANQLTGAGTALGTGFKVPGSTTTYLQANPLSFQGKCNTIPGMSQYATDLWKDVTPPSRTTYSCAYDYGADYVIASPTDRLNALGRSVFKLTNDSRVFVEALASRARVLSSLTPVQVSTSLAAGNAYPVGGPYYQDLSAYVPTFDKTKPIIYKWRGGILGDRTQENQTDNARLLVGLEGTLAKWDYKLGVSKAYSKTQTDLKDGYALTAPFYKVLGSGIVNPWLAPGQTQTQAAIDAVNATKYIGKLQHGRTTLSQVDGSMSGEVFSLPAGPVSAAVGFDLRKEGYGFAQDTDATLILLAPGNARLNDATRHIKAVYTEVIVPVTKKLEVQLAVRRDDYSIVGATTNPKVAFRFEPVSWLLFRGSANTGFLAPSFTQLYSQQLPLELPNGIIDPLGCPTHPGDPAYCAISRLGYLSGGNPKLKPETSKQGTLGFVVEPVKGWSVGVDYWAINSKDKILNRTPQVILANYTLLPENIIRNPDGTINHIEAGWINAAGSKTRGADLNARAEGKFGTYKWSAGLDGTWTQTFQFAEIEGQPFKEFVGNFYTRDLYLRWKHQARFNVSKGDWSTEISQSYSSGYNDQLPDAGKAPPPPGFNPRVDSHIRYNLSATYTGVKNLTLTGGILNLLDKDPEFTAHNVDEVVGAGWDPRVSDPRGRTFTLTARYKF